MTCIADLFERDITRPIDGVIKADDRAGLMMELEEYVITNEISKRLSDFLEEYNNYSNKNGVWISGFFGSGKSHLLKMLSLALEGAKVDEVSAADLFSQNVQTTVSQSGSRQSLPDPFKERIIQHRPEGRNHFEQRCRQAADCVSISV